MRNRKRTAVIAAAVVLAAFAVVFYYRSTLEKPVTVREAAEGFPFDSLISAYARYDSGGDFIRAKAADDDLSRIAEKLGGIKVKAIEQDPRAMHGSAIFLYGQDGGSRMNLIVALRDDGRLIIDDKQWQTLDGGSAFGEILAGYFSERLMEAPFGRFFPELEDAAEVMASNGRDGIAWVLDDAQRDQLWAQLSDVELHLESNVDREMPEPSYILGFDGTTLYITSEYMWIEDDGGKEVFHMDGRYDTDALAAILE